MLACIARILEGLICRMKQEALLRIHHLCFPRRNRKKGVVEQVGIIDEIPGFRTNALSVETTCGDLQKIIRVQSHRQKGNTDLAQRVDTIIKQLPQFIHIRRLGKIDRHTDDRNFIVWALRRTTIARCSRGDPWCARGPGWRDARGGNSGGPNNAPVDHSRSGTRWIG